MRIFRLIATPILLLGLLGLLLWGASWGWKALTEPLPSPSPTPCVVGPAEVVTPADISVRVLNGGFTSGLANRVGSHMERAGFTVIRVGNTDERVFGTVIRANQRDTLQVDLVASQFIEPVIEYDDRVDGTVDILVGTDFRGSNPSPPSTQATPTDGQFCRVPSPSPSPSVLETPASSPSAAPATPQPTTEG
ncbi:LytR C-terminal domain-containing protein [Tessaracoccus sp. Z1128]